MKNFFCAAFSVQRLTNGEKYGIIHKIGKLCTDPRPTISRSFPQAEPFRIARSIFFVKRTDFDFSNSAFFTIAGNFGRGNGIRKGIS